MLRRYEERFKERDKTPSDRLADELVRSFLSGEPAPGVEIEYEIAKKYVPSIKVEEVNEYAASLSFDKNQVVTVSLPEKAGLHVPTEKELAAMFTTVRAKSIEPYVDEVANKPLAEVPASTISITDTREVKELGLTIWTLSNGIRVVIKPTDFKNDEILFSAYSPGGLSVLHDSVFVSASQAADIVNESGIGEFDNTQLQKLLVGKIANVSPTISDLEQGFQGNAAPKDLETMFQMLYLYFAHPRKDTVAFQSMMKRMKTMYEGMSAYPEMVFFDSVTAVLTQRHFRGRRRNEKLLGEVSLDVAFRQYQNRFSDASDYTMFFVGNITPETLKPLALKYLGALPATGRKETWRDVGMRMPEGAVEKTVYKGIEKKSMVALAFNGPFEWTPQNRYDFSALKELLTIKLREAVREEKGGTYGVQVSFEPSKYPRSEYQAAVIFGCNPDRVDELITTAVEVMKDVVAKGASEEDVKKIQEIQRREFEKNQKENGFWAGSLKFYFSNGDDPLSLLGYPSRVDALTSKAIQDAAARYLTFGSMKKFVLRPEQK
jgi:zinc protease